MLRHARKRASRLLALTNLNESGMSGQIGVGGFVETLNN